MRVRNAVFCLIDSNCPTVIGPKAHFKSEKICLEQSKRDLVFRPPMSGTSQLRTRITELVSIATGSWSCLYLPLISMLYEHRQPSSSPHTPHTTFMSDTFLAHRGSKGLARPSVKIQLLRTTDTNTKHSLAL